MTRHEALLVVSAMMGPPQSVPPLWADVIATCRRNLPDDDPGGFATVLRRLQKKGLVHAGRCSATCHAKHVWLSAEGASWLRVWNERGCGEECDAGCYREIEYEWE